MFWCPMFGRMLAWQEFGHENDVGECWHENDVGECWHENDVVECWHENDVIVSSGNKAGWQGRKPVWNTQVFSPRDQDSTRGFKPTESVPLVGRFGTSLYD